LHPTRTARRFDAVLFDLDGVLVDSEPWWNDVRIAFARAHGRPWTRDDHHAVMGANSRGWALTMQERLGLRDMDVDAIQDAIVDGVVARYRSEPPPVIDGAVEAVRRIAAELPVAIASSAHPDVIAAAVDALGVRDVLGAIVSSDEVPHGKPAPDVYLVAARRLGVEAARCLVVEDSVNGVKAGKAAGMFVVLVPNASVPPPPGTEALADAVVDRLADLDPERVAG
jgi:HAD superfamily hydrolase (TIGR01509 family)